MFNFINLQGKLEPSTPTQASKVAIIQMKATLIDDYAKDGGPVKV